jgi:20S proteasome subunit beta 3
MGSPMEINGGSVIAMTGKDCVAIASDLRLGMQAVGLSADFEKVSQRVDRNLKARDTPLDNSVQLLEEGMSVETKLDAIDQYQQSS